LPYSSSISRSSQCCRTATCLRRTTPGE